MSKSPKSFPVRRSRDGTVTFGADDTEHLLSSRENRRRLFSALAQVNAGGGVERDLIE